MKLFKKIYNLKHCLTAVLFTLTVLTISGCKHLPFELATAPNPEMIFDRFEAVEIGETTVSEVLAYIQNPELNEMLSQDEQTIASWGHQRDGAVIWINAVTFDEITDVASRKYAILIYEDSPDWKRLNIAGSESFRADFEFVLPPEFDELDIRTENQRRREALKAAAQLYVRDTNTIRFDSDYIYTTAMLLRQIFNVMLYELERVPAKLALIEERDGIEFTHPTMGPGRARMLIDDDFVVRLKVKIGSSTKNFATHRDVIAMDTPEFAQRRAVAAATPDAPTPAERRTSIFERLDAAQAQQPRRSPEVLEQIEEMARQRAAQDIEQMRRQVDEAIEIEDQEQPEPEDEAVDLPEIIIEPPQPEEDEQEEEDEPQEQE